MAKKEEIIANINDIYLKVNNISQMLKDGKVIVAYEKLGGLMKNIQNLGSQINESDIKN
jgi:hypothetical protein